MKVYLDVEPRSLGRAMYRVSEALARTAPPDVELVQDPTEADLMVCHLVGWAHWESLRPLALGRKYAVIQYCLKTTERVVDVWREQVWAGAQVVWSYYDLGWAGQYYAPLGVDPMFTQFTPVSRMKRYLVGTSGYVAGQECIDDWAKVVHDHGDRQFHLGPDLKLPADITYANGIDDAELARRWSSCWYVSGLRRTEGFELPAYEGLACGARPVMFDRPDARAWMGEYAEYIPEVPDVRPYLMELASLKHYRPVTREEMDWVRATFDWGRIARGFWARVQG